NEKHERKILKSLCKRVMNMEQEKSGRCPKCGADGSCRPVGKKEFNKLLKAMLKVPPPKSWKEKREKD
ncbi:2575_t:CDS:1, partial [Scutellospora calospora]